MSFVSIGKICSGVGELCPICGAPAVPGKMECATCRNFRNQTKGVEEKKLRIAYFEAGLCTVCGQKPPKQGHRLCKECGQKMYSAAKSSHKYKQIARLVQNIKPEKPFGLPLDEMIHQGDALQVLKTLPGDSVQCVVTSPPYWGLRDYGIDDQLGLEPTPEEYVAKMVEICREVKRVLRPDGTLWLNLGDSYAATTKGSGGHNPKQDSNAGSWHDRRGWSIPPGLKPKDLVGIPWRVAFALQADGWYLRQDIIWHKPNPMPESVTDRCTKAHEYMFLFTKSARYYYDADAVREISINPDDNRASREKRYSKDEKYISRPNPATAKNYPFRNKRSVWTIATHPYPEAHFATFPEKLVEPCILAGSKEGDVVLDPFCGAGTTGAVALRLGREFIGIELNPEYIELAEKRLAPIIAQGKLAFDAPLLPKVE